MCSRAFLLLLGSCGGGERRVAPFGWSAVSPEADTLTLGLEWSFMNDLTDPEAALECFDKADSIFRSVGFREMVLKNNINRANSYANAGDTVRAAEVLRGVLDDPAAREDPLAVNTA